MESTSLKMLLVLNQLLQLPYWCHQKLLLLNQLDHDVVIMTTVSYQFWKQLRV